jgi:hypothetical protein
MSSNRPRKKGKVIEAIRDCINDGVFTVDHEWIVTFLSLSRGDEYLSCLLLYRYAFLDDRRTRDALSSGARVAKTTSYAPYAAGPVRGLGRANCDGTFN